MGEVCVLNFISPCERGYYLMLTSIEKGRRNDTRGSLKVKYYKRRGEERKDFFTIAFVRGLKTSEKEN